MDAGLASHIFKVKDPVSEEELGLSLASAYHCSTACGKQEDMVSMWGRGSWNRDAANLPTKYSSWTGGDEYQVFGLLAASRGETG